MLINLNHLLLVIKRTERVLLSIDERLIPCILQDELLCLPVPLSKLNDAFCKTLLGLGSESADGLSKLLVRGLSSERSQFLKLPASLIRP